MERMESIRKRARTSFTETTEDPSSSTTAFTALSSSSIPPPLSSYKNPTSQHLLNEIDKLKAELSKVKSQRQLDKIQAENNQKRMTRHIRALEDDAKDANELAEQIRKQTDDALEDMTAKRSQAISDAEEWENRYWDLKDGIVNDNEELENDLSLSEQKNQMLQEKVQAMEDEVSSLKHKLASVSASASVSLGRNGNVQDILDSSDDEADIARTRNTTTTPIKQPPQNSEGNPISPAPPAVLTELNKTRVSLAESERHVRQLTRKTQELRSKADEMIQYRERAQNAHHKIEQLERDLKVVRREREALRIIEGRWEEFRKELVKHGIGSEIINNVHGHGHGHGFGSGTVVDENVPPEIATVVRHFRSLEQEVERLEMEESSHRTKLEAAQRHQMALEKKNGEHGVEYEKLMNEKNAMKEKLRHNEMELQTMKAREKVWNRESEGMRSLLDTYEKMEQNMAKSRSSRSSKAETKAVAVGGFGEGSHASAEALQLSLSTAQHEIKLLKEQFDKAKSERDAIENDSKALKEEHEKVRKKFGQLREALFQERDKAEKADERAFKAEAMAGKGAFNNETTRVLHLQDNPLSNKIREKFQNEIEALREALQVREAELADAASRSSSKGGATKTISSKKVGPSSNLDAQKYNKRLKDKFREQIGLFREGVYLITGYKIDMNFDNTGLSDNIHFKVRSIFAEREADHLELLWRKDKDGNRASSLDIMNTELAQELMKEDSFDYMKKFKSLPAFMASVCLTLFDKQTIMVS